MVHLPALPGSPQFGGSMVDVLDRARTDAVRLAEAGFPALMVENFGDVPFFADAVPPETTSAMALAVRSVIEETDLVVGVNVLRNDVLSALGIAATADASFVRVNIFTGLMYTDQGPIVGKAAEALRKREAIAPDVEIWADVMVKHSTAPPGLDIGRSAADTVERGLADAVVVSGTGTGSAPDLEDAKAIRTNTPEDTRIVVGSGAHAGNLEFIAEVANSVIVGSSTKHDGDARNAVDPKRAWHLVQAAKDCGLA